METHLSFNKILLIGFALILALAIPTLLIVERFLTLRETETWLSQLSAQRTDTAVPAATGTPTPTDTHTPTDTSSPTPSPTPTHSPTPSTTEFLVPDPGDGSINGYVDQVVHLDDDGPQTMIKIISEDALLGYYRAEIQIQWNTWRYDCFVLGDKNDNLFCLGRRLPITNQATIKVFEVLGTGEDQQVFESSFQVPAPGPTATPKPRNTSRPPAPTNAPTDTPIPPTSTPPPTLTPTATFTPSVIPTNTDAPPSTPWAPTPTPP
jgi:hypothetical protein